MAAFLLSVTVEVSAAANDTTTSQVKNKKAKVKKKTQKQKKASKKSEVKAEPNQKVKKGSKKSQDADPKANILQPYGVEVNSTHALLVDYETGRVLLAKNPDEVLEPASMTKIMTAYMVTKAISTGRINHDSMVTISRNARKMEGSDMFLEVGDQVSVSDLIKGLIIVSGNDAAIALAEFVSGTQDSFAEDMTKVAKEMGCKQTVFKNASGLPHEGHQSSARDLLIMSIRSFEDFPQWYAIYKETSFTYRGITQPNRNVLLNGNTGCDGIKTGHTEKAGYCIVVSAVKNGRRLFLVVAGLPSMKARAEEAARLLQWGFDTFGNYTIFPSDKPMLEIPVRYGVEDKITVVPAKHQLNLHRNRLDQTKAVVYYENVIEAPIKAGTKVGEVIVTHPDWDEKKVVIPLLASKDIEKTSFFFRIGQTLQYLFQKG